MQKLPRKAVPSGHCPTEFQYRGRPASEQGDFGPDVGLADMACIDQFGANKAKHYHAGVVQARDRTWWVYLEWGRIGSGNSWANGQSPRDFQFVSCDTEGQARAFFARQLRSKNTARLRKENLGDHSIWTARPGKDAYLVQRLAARSRGLPDAQTMRSVEGVSPTPSTDPGSPTVDKQVSYLARDLCNLTQAYTRAASMVCGVMPTLSTIQEVREELLPLALGRLAVLGPDIASQLRDPVLIDLSKLVAALIPRPVPRTAALHQRAAASLLSAENILSLQRDLDAFEAALRTEAAELSTHLPDPVSQLGAQLSWLDPASPAHHWVHQSLSRMSNNRHAYLQGKSLHIRQAFSVAQPQLDAAFRQSCARVAARLQTRSSTQRARLQPAARPDLTDLGDHAQQANVFLGIHGSRAVNLQPILQTGLRLPRSLRGVHLSGAAFGHGIYFATDWRKAYGYTGHNKAYWGSARGIPGRGFFVLLCDVIMGQPYLARSTGSWVKPPGNCDSIAAYTSHIRTLANDEHIVFNPSHQRIRYLVEAELR